MQAITRFDQVIWGFLLVVSLLTGLIIWRGDQVGLTIKAVTPDVESSGISTRTQIRIQFDAPLDRVGDDVLTFSPPISGQTRIQNNLLVFTPDEPFAADTQYEATLTTSITSQSQRTLKAPFTWQFTTSHPRILFVSWGEDEIGQVYVAEPDGSEPPRPLSSVSQDVLDFAVSGDGSLIVFSVYRQDGGTDLWRMDGNGRNQSLLLDCEMASCGNPQFLPDSRRVIYERRTIPAPGAPPGAPRLWWLDITSGETVPVFQDSQLLGLGVRISPDGRWFSYVSPVDQGIQVYNLEDGSGLFVPNQMGSPAVWSPDSQQLLVNDIQLGDETRWAVHLLAIDVDSEAIVSLSGEGVENVDDSNPAWSPNGEWIAFGRKEARTAMGRQLWLMTPDGDNPTPLTDDPDVHHGPFVWSPNGRYLLLQRYALTELYAQPAVWVYDTESGEMLEIASPGTQPLAWLP